MTVEYGNLNPPGPGYHDYGTDRNWPALREAAEAARVQLAEGPP